MKRCFIDMDEVLVDFAGGIFRLLGKPVPENLAWNFTDEYPGMLEKLGFSFWSTLNYTRDCRRILGFAEDNFGIENCCILSAPCPAHGCMDGKRAWIERYLPVFKNRLLLGTAKEFCAHPNAWLIDDLDVNVEKFKAAGGNTILIPRTWNKNNGLALSDVLHF